MSERTQYEASFQYSLNDRDKENIEAVYGDFGQFCMSIMNAAIEGAKEHRSLGFQLHVEPWHPITAADKYIEPRPGTIQIHPNVRLP